MTPQLIAVINLLMQGARSLAEVLSVSDDVSIEELNATKAELDSTHSSLMAKIDEIKAAREANPE